MRLHQTSLIVLSFAIGVLVGVTVSAVLVAIHGAVLFIVDAEHAVLPLTLWTALGSGLGAFVGVVLLFGLRWIMEVEKSKPKEIRWYDAVSKLNRGDKGEQNGELMHHFGKRTPHPDIPGREVWECVKIPAGDHHQNASAYIYGPYSSDCHEPGVYIARFRIRGLGFGKPHEVEVDRNVLILDVAQNCLTSHDGKWLELNNRVAISFLKARDIARDGWQDYEVRFHSDGRGTWEYRAIPYDDNLSKCGQDARVLIDSITVLQCAASVPIPMV
jgi:hypothetical protein